MDQAQPNSNASHAGFTFTEIEPATYLITFTEYSLDKARNANQARQYLEHVKRAAASHEKINIINDTSEVSSIVKGLASEAREAYRQAYALPQIKMVVMVGFNSWLKNFILVLARLANRTAQTSFFDTKEEALDWIHQHQK